MNKLSLFITPCLTTQHGIFCTTSLPLSSTIHPVPIEFYLERTCSDWDTCYNSWSLSLSLFSCVLTLPKDYLLHTVRASPQAFCFTPTSPPTGVALERNHEFLTLSSHPFSLSHMASNLQIIFLLFFLSYGCCKDSKH